METPIDPHIPWVLDAGGLDRARRLVMAASAVAQEALRACGSRRPLRIEADAVRAARTFAAVLEGPAPVLTDVLDVFIPTTLLASRTQSVREAHAAALDDGTSCPSWVALSANAPGSGPRHAALGDTWLLPPVHADEAASRDRWIEERLIDPASHAEPGGPWWRLGNWNRWRLPVLGWPEQLAIAGLVGTACTASVVVGPPRLVPRIGFVPAAAAWLQRTLVFVSTERFDPHVCAALRFRHRRNRAPLSALLGFPEV